VNDVLKKEKAGSFSRPAFGFQNAFKS